MNKQTPPEPEKKATPKRRELMTLGALVLGLGLITALFLLTLSKNQPAAIAADVSAVQIKAGSSLTNLPLAEGIESPEVLAQLHPVELAGESRAFMPQNAQ